jgi:hypothetical protein
MVLAHTTAGGTIEIELLLLGLGFLAAAFFFRPSQTGNPRAAVVTLVVGIGLIAGSFVLPQVQTDAPTSDATLQITSPQDGDTVDAGDPVAVTVDLEGGTIASRSSPSGGHMHIFVDDILESMPTSLNMEVELQPGEHQIRVEYVDPKHMSFVPPVQEVVTVTAR